MAVYLEERKDCLMVGDMQTGYIVVPHSAALYGELATRCETTGRVPPKWVRKFVAKMADTR